MAEIIDYGSTSVLTDLLKKQNALLAQILDCLKNQTELLEEIASNTQ